MKKTKRYFKPGTPTIRNKAAVITTDLTIRFIAKEQCDLFVRDLVAQESHPNFSVSTIGGDSLVLDEFHVTIHDICWAHNLTAVAKLLERYDFAEA